MSFPWNVPSLRTPCYLVDLGLLRRNAALLGQVHARTGAQVLLALKAFAMWSVFDVVRPYLQGASASGLYEARLGREALGGQVHVCGPAYREDEVDELFAVADHVVFNSPDQWRRLRDRALAAGVQAGLRLNPEHREVKTALYDPCGPGSRLGIVRAQFTADLLEGVSGLHFHTLCELNADALERTLAAVRERFGAFLGQVAWVNFGGGHHVTRDDYDVELLCRLIDNFQQDYGVQVYLEPGEAIALNTGYLVSTVLEIVHNDIDIAILDTSAAAHMPDVLEMPYRPQVEGAAEPGRQTHTYRLAGPTCLAGDVIGDYAFAEPLRPGSRVVFHDMAHYTMVKNNTFNGIGLPDIVTYEPETGAVRVVRRFGYEDFKTRLS